MELIIKEFENISLEESLNIVKNPDEQILKLAKFNVALYLLFAKEFFFRWSLANY